MEMEIEKHKNILLSVAIMHPQNSNLRKLAKTLWILKNFKIIKIWKIMKTYNIKNMMIFKIKILNKLKINKISKIIIIEINF